MYGYDDSDDRPRFNPKSDEWQTAVAGVREMLNRSNRLREAAQPANHVEPTVDKEQ
ncbi:hypothetical protein ACFVVA_28885 [Kitasatospora sp. NPDC058048]|uniref:hypothetical protein n=1 Tax=Kitasatospora sp. NPDC058048 TaxID=3346313 RepID=UPI0036DCB5B9